MLLGFEFCLSGKPDGLNADCSLLGVLRRSHSEPTSAGRLSGSNPHSRNRAREVFTLSQFPDLAVKPHAPGVSLPCVKDH